MDWLLFFLVLHLIGAVLGVGGASVSDAMFFRSVKDRKVSRDELALLHMGGRVVWTGLAISLLSGIGMLILQHVQTGSVAYFSLGWFQVKMIIFGVIFGNGLVFHLKVLPFLETIAGRNISYELIKPRIPLFAVTGTLSMVSWYSVLILGVTRGLGLPFWYLLNAYAVLIAGGMAMAFLILSLVIFRPKAKPDSTGRNAPRRAEYVPTATMRIDSFSFPKLRAAFAAGITMIIAGALGFIAMGMIDQRRTVVEEGQEHIVCIREVPPWFDRDVLRIEKGDTVVWVHCDEEQGGHAIYPHARTILIREALAHDGHSHGHNHVHTHPIAAISGPELFSSGLRPIGHLEDGNEFRHTFTQEGVYEYICPTHPYMKGIIAVGVEPPVNSLWPPEELIMPELLPPPDIPGVGEIWVNTQFERVPGQEYPGTITVINAETWEIEEVVSHETFNNPHNLWNTPDGNFIFQTQWHSDQFAKINVETREVIESVSLGNAPAHVFVHPHRDRVYVTMNNEHRVAVLDTDLNHIRDIETSFGPHGIWISPDGRWMSIAATLSEKFDIIDLEQEEVVATFDAPGLPLATQITNDSRYAMISLLLENKVRFIDLETMEHVADVGVGAMPIWAMPDPTGEHILVPNTGSADISVISLDSFEVVQTIPAAAGAHGVIFGEKQGGGYYGYFSNKFARVVGVIDMDTMEIAGHIQLGEEQWGGNGILVLPNLYDAFAGN